MFLCHQTQRCIPRSWLCDQENDCPDGEDEKNCGLDAQKRCGPNEYECRNSGGVHHVPDANPWLSHLASTGYTHTCIPEKWKCDGEPDCVEKDDELGCDDQKPKCNATTHFECRSFGYSLSTSCIPIEWVCDGQSDCLEMEDEHQNCTLKENKRKCEPHPKEFTCPNGNCIYGSWVCDGDNDCGDDVGPDHVGSDELNCEKDTCSSVDKFKCTTTNFCIPNKWRCDGEPDCPDHSDETNCGDKLHVKEVQCKDNEHRCDSHAQCISKYWLCDGDEDCFDGSDERNCTQQAQCKSNERACKDGKQCVDKDLWCDQTEDCLDGSDEGKAADCPTVTPSATCNAQREFSCPGEAKCIKYEDFCIGLANSCADRTLCAKQHRFCSKTGSTGAEDACLTRKLTNNGQISYCARGFNAAPIGSGVPGTCQDIDECEQPGACDQLCTNLPGSYMCACHHGYKLVSEEKSNKPVQHKCRAIGPDPLLLLANRAAIRKFDIITNKYHPLINTLESAVALDYWYANHTLVWSDVSKEQIMICTGINVDADEHAVLASISACAEGSANVTVIKDNITTPDGLALDWVHGLLFWTDTGLDNINVYDLNTKKRKVLISGGLDEPRAIAVDPSAGLIFWTDWGNNASIERAGMDGENRQKIMSGSSVKWPNGLALDILDKRVYWADAKTKQISSCDYWGANSRVILHSHQHIRHPFSLAVFEEKLYWTDWDQEGVLTANKFDAKDVRKLVGGVSGPMTVRVYHQQAQPKHANKCSYHDCEHMCLPRALFQKSSNAEEQQMAGVPYSCACDSGFRIDVANRSMCIPLDPIGAASKAVVETYAEVEGSSGSSTYIFGFLFVCVVAIVAFAYYRRRPRHFAALRFENPIYRRTVEADLDADLEQHMGGDNSLGPIEATRFEGGGGGLTGGSSGVAQQQDPQVKLVLSAQDMHRAQQIDMSNPNEYAYDQPRPKQ